MPCRHESAIPPEAPMFPLRRLYLSAAKPITWRLVANKRRRRNAARLLCGLDCCGVNIAFTKRASKSYTLKTSNGQRNAGAPKQTSNAHSSACNRADSSATRQVSGKGGRPGLSLSICLHICPDNTLQYSTQRNHFRSHVTSASFTIELSVPQPPSPGRLSGHLRPQHSSLRLHFRPKRRMR